jgi:hypothetical protein
MALLRDARLSDPAYQRDYERALAVRAPEDPVVTDDAWGKERIFVSIASFRDPECQLTIKDMFEKADRPERIHLGLVCQYDPKFDKDLFEVDPPRPGQVRELLFDWRESKGVCWARFLAQAMWRNEEYFLQIDSHMRFAKGWDTMLIDELASCGSEKAVLASCAPPYLTPGDLIQDVHPGIIRTDGFLEDGALRFTGVWQGGKIEASHRMPFVMAGALFSKAAMIQEVPYDPYQHFETEEVTYAMRLYTHGWDVFLAREQTVWHQFQRNNTIKRRSAEGADFVAARDARSTRAYRRFNHISDHALSENPDVLRDLQLFDLGDKRSLAQYEDFAGLDFRRKRASEHAMRARFIEGIEDIVTFVVPPLDGPGPRPQLMSENERQLRIVLRSWTLPALADELAGLLVSIKLSQDPTAQLEKGHDELLSDFLSWSKDILVSELAHLAWMVNQHNENAARAAA